MFSTHFFRKLRIMCEPTLDPATAAGLAVTIVSGLSIDSKYVADALGIDLAGLLRPALERVTVAQHEEFILTRPLPGSDSALCGSDLSMRRPMAPLPMPGTHAELASIAKEAHRRSVADPFGRVAPETICPTFWQQVSQRCRLLSPWQADWVRNRMRLLASGSVSDFGEIPPEPKLPTREELFAGAARGAAERQKQAAALHCSKCQAFRPFGRAGDSGLCPNCEPAAEAVSV